MHRWHSYKCKTPLISTFSRLSTNASSEKLVVNIPKADVYRFGDGKHAQPLFGDLNWIAKEGESWAVIGSGGGGEKTACSIHILGRYRIAPYPPPPGGIFPFLTLAGLDPYSEVFIVSFGHRQQAGGAFYDYSARYGAVHEEDRLTLRQSMFPETFLHFVCLKRTLLIRLILCPPVSVEESTRFNELVAQMGLGQFLDLPLIALSNGQTRCARILKAVLKKPKLLLLDEPLTGLDVKTRPLLLSTLHDLHVKKEPRVIIGLRGQDVLPDWVDHVVYVKGSMVTAGERESVLREVELGLGGWASQPKKNKGTASSAPKIGQILIDLKNVKVQYSDRKARRTMAFSRREWLWQNSHFSPSLQVTIHNPISQTRYAPQDSSSSNSPHETSSHLQLFSQPRSRLPTTLLRSAIAILSPELFDAFPRRSNMTVWDVIGTGFDGDFVPKGKKSVGSGIGMQVSSSLSREGRGGCEGSMEGQDGWKEEESWRMARVWEVLEALGPDAWQRANASESAITSPSPDTSPSSSLTHQFAQTSFPSLPLPQQRIVLLMRALVGRPPLILLDEVWSGMDETMVRVAREYLRGDCLAAGRAGRAGVSPDQAVVVITHWEEEVPWNRDEDAGVFRKFRLSGGKGWVEE
ncbi:P-loop containing nucleoside triphosphate hydrolase protein [Gymnopus androsaceus JB14]|uniref:P-loop containing nucleoside triphosphate hydrolase protein n=1 Tax=Gymnopus androsaceus JB14 TaxID=1447944 RepID=A0A6A4GLZ5_9AGAR|nr:P-loop containing nucleoside triphosphate hydrolase protein [Gymnopus androsaceus JB14]